LSVFRYLNGIHSEAALVLRFNSGTLSFVAARSTTRPLPGRQALSREFIAEHQRARIIAALAEETAERSYRAVTVAHIVKRAGIARNTFYENYGSKEECFHAAQEYAMSTALERVVSAAGEIDDWPLRVRAGLAAFLSYVTAEPALARTCMVEALSAGPASVRYYEESQQAFVSLFRLGRDVSSRGGELPETLEEALIGGVFWLTYQRLTGPEPDKIGELLPELTEFILTPYLGADEAGEIAAGNTEVGSGEGLETGERDEKLASRPKRA
jgi:AcrR family transcriptional regulator